MGYCGDNYEASRKRKFFAAMIILDAKTFDGKTILIKLRNHLGECEWNEAYNEKDNPWKENKELEKFFILEEKNEGIFFISHEDYIQNYHITWGE